MMPTVGDRVIGHVIGTERMSHTCPVCQQQWQCATQQAGRRCCSTIDGDRCHSCIRAWRADVLRAMGSDIPTTEDDLR